MSEAVQPLDAVAPRPLQDHAFSGGGEVQVRNRPLAQPPPPCQRAGVSTHKPLGPRSGRKESRLTSRNSACGARSRRYQGNQGQPGNPLSTRAKREGAVPLRDSPGKRSSPARYSGNSPAVSVGKEPGGGLERGSQLPPTLASCLSAAATPSPDTWMHLAAAFIPHHPPLLPSTDSILPVIGDGRGVLLHLPGAQ